MIANRQLADRPLSLGVDPGYTGGLALYDLEQKQLIQVIQMPLIKTKKADGMAKRRINIPHLSIWLDLYRDMIRGAVIEEVGSRPAQGVVSVFNFGMGTGILHGLIGANMIPIYTVRPATWKANTGLTHNKSLSVERARHLFPTHMSQFTRLSDNGKAEAAILAKYGERFFGALKPAAGLI